MIIFTFHFFQVEKYSLEDMWNMVKFYKSLWVNWKISTELEFMLDWIIELCCNHLGTIERFAVTIKTEVVRNYSIISSQFFAISLSYSQKNVQIFLTYWKSKYKRKHINWHKNE